MVRIEDALREISGAYTPQGEDTARDGISVMMVGAIEISERIDSSEEDSSVLSNSYEMMKGVVRESEGVAGDEEGGCSLISEDFDAPS